MISAAYAGCPLPNEEHAVYTITLESAPTEAKTTLLRVLRTTLQLPIAEVMNRYNQGFPMVLAKDVERFEARRLVRDFACLTKVGCALKVTPLLNPEDAYAVAIRGVTL